MDSNNTLVCGGPNCNGTIGESIRAFKKAEDLSKNLTAVSEDLMNVATKVRECVYVQMCGVTWLQTSHFICLHFRFSVMWLYLHDSRCHYNDNMIHSKEALNNL